MKKAILSIAGQVFCTLEIADTPVPTTANMVDTITITEGFGTAVPTLELLLLDHNGSLSEELALMEGKRISIVLSKDAQTTHRQMNFRLFGYTSIDTVDGPRLQIVAILEASTYVNACLTFSEKGTSANVMSTVARKAGFNYSGPDSTQDNMTWLNVCTNLVSFSEDVAIHGWASNSSCMFRVVNSSNTLVYKDLFKVLKETEKVTFKYNTSIVNRDVNGVIVREAKAISRGGVVSHWLNYGYELHYHDLENNQQSIKSAKAPIANGFPVNADIKNKVKVAKKDYEGLNTGFGSQSNVHKNYTQAKYQNTRFYALFTDGLKLLVEQYSGAYPGDPAKVEYFTMRNGNNLQDNRYSGHYIIANKTTRLKNGIRYYEMHTLTRPNVGNAHADS